jgi:hypothetical protein
VVSVAAVANVGFGKVFAIGDSNIFADEPDSDIPGDYIDVFDNRRLLKKCHKLVTSVFGYCWPNTDYPQGLLHSLSTCLVRK